MLTVDIAEHGMQQHLIARRDLAQRWGIDHRHAIFHQLRPAATVKIGGKTRELFDASLSRSRCLDYLRVLRAKTPLRQAALKKFLEADYGKGWFEATEQNFLK